MHIIIITSPKNTNYYLADLSISKKLKVEKIVLNQLATIPI